jgi:GTP pyrophosphokinase
LIGREEVKKILRELAKPLTEDQRDTILNNIAERAGFGSLDDFYSAIGYGGQSVSKLYIKIKDEIDRAAKENLIFDIQEIEFEEPKIYSDGTEVIVDGLDNCSIKFAKCCNPVRGDKIAGFATKGHGMSIHRDDCRNFIDLRSLEENYSRVFSAFWNESKKSEENNRDGFVSLLKISAVDDMDLMRRIVELVNDMRVPMHGINKVSKKSDGSIIIDLLISARDVDHLKYITGRLKLIKNIRDAGRNAFDLAGVK